MNGVSLHASCALNGDCNNKESPSKAPCSCTFASLQEHAFEESQKYKEGKFIVEKAKVLKVRDHRVSTATGEACLGTSFSQGDTRSTNHASAC